VGCRNVRVVSGEWGGVSTDSVRSMGVRV